MEKLSLTLSVHSVGPNAVMFYLPEPIQETYPVILHELSQQLTRSGVIDCVIAYHSLLVIFDPLRQDIHQLSLLLNQALPQAMHRATLARQQNLIKIPVCYAAPFAPDLIEVAKQGNLTVNEVILCHTQKTYQVCCLGFIPGFAFLGYVDDQIATPRRAEPRRHIAQGSVGIAGRQTGIYPEESPGGWQIIGRTPKRLYDPAHGLISCFEMGDRVQFYAISMDEFKEWERQYQRPQ